jgi:CO dehydrogenase/acetyl-CoA synthase delta subunit
VIEPPGNSLASTQDGKVVEPGGDLAAGMRLLLARITEEIDFNDAKGAAPYRLGVHDGLRFAEDAIADLLRRHGHAAETADRSIDA